MTLTMTAQPSPTWPTLQWPRVAGWSGSIAIHAAILLVLFMPFQKTLVPLAHKEVTTFVRIIEPPVPVRDVQMPIPPIKLRPVEHLSPPRQPAQFHVPTPPVLASISSVPAPIAEVPSPPSIAPAGQTLPPHALAYKSRSKVPYPITALRRHAEGAVLLRVLVWPDGKPHEVKVAKSSGSSDLDAAARSAVLTWTFEPGVVDGRPQAAWAELTIRFSMNDL